MLTSHWKVLAAAASAALSISSLCAAVQSSAQTTSTSRRAEADPFTLRLAQGERSRALEVSGHGYPQLPVRIIVNVTAGGGVDNVARIAAQHYSALWNQPFVVDNRTGAGGSIGVDLVAKAAPEGYTLLVSSSGIVTNAAIRPQGYDPVRDLQAVTMITAAPYLVLTTPSLPVASVKDLVALAKSKPGAISFASAGTGSIVQMGAELLVALSGTQMLHVPYKGVADAYPAVVSGDVNWMPVSPSPRFRSSRRDGSRRSP